MARFLSTLEPIMVRNFEALKTRLVNPYDLRLHPQPFHAFLRQTYHCFHAGFYAANDALAWAAAPVIACVKSIGNRFHAFSTVKGANEVVAIRVMKRVAKRNNIDPMAAV